MPMPLPSIHAVNEIAIAAGRLIRQIYQDTAYLQTVEQKDDLSPVTIADKQANDLIVQALSALPNPFPVVSEEGIHTADSDTYWLVDPLDGTKQFIRRKGHFTVNIALVQDRFPVLGILYDPMAQILYYADGQQSYRQIADGQPETIQVSGKSFGQDLHALRSSSYIDPEEEALYARWEVGRISHLGSAIKFARIAEGVADLYARKGRTMAWDTAAGQAIVEQSGGAVHDQRGQRYHYDLNRLENEFFVVMGIRQDQWQKVW